VANLATSFAEAVAENFRDVFLGAGHFTEEVTYYPKDGEPRAVSAIVVRQQHTEQEEHQAFQVETLSVLLGRDEAAAVGGVASPQIEDYLHRPLDAADVFYVFRGKVIEETPASWTLEFERRRPYQVGLKQTR
jgi:hypothetical protein